MGPGAQSAEIAFRAPAEVVEAPAASNADVVSVVQSEYVEEYETVYETETDERGAGTTIAVIGDSAGGGRGEGAGAARGLQPEAAADATTATVEAAVEAVRKVSVGVVETEAVMTAEDSNAGPWEAAARYQVRSQAALWKSNDEGSAPCNS